MTRTLSTPLRLGALLLLLSFFGGAVAHGNDHHDMSMDMHSAEASQTPSAHAVDNGSASDSTSYFAYQEHVGTIVAHVALMVLAWFFVLPLGVFFSAARSGLALPVQFLFLIINAFGLLLGVVYNKQTPDLYENNAHHKIGWIATWAMTAEVVMGILLVLPRRDGHSKSNSHEQVAFLPVSTTDSSEDSPRTYRWSGDSGQGTERSSSSLEARYSYPGRGRRLSRHGDGDPLSDKIDDDEVMSDVPVAERGRFFGFGFIDRYLLSRLPGLHSGRARKIVRVIHTVIERTILPFGFVALASGAVTYGGVFKGSGVFSGLAHFIKGGIFVWYGLLTLGRWMGCFADFGWAWNLKPSRDLVGWRARVPTAEFTESFVIFLYGATNVFLEHLAAWGGAWTAVDLEHLSITIMFFGGGLCGMLAESKTIREWVNQTTLPPPSHRGGGLSPVDTEDWQPPKSQGQSLNPMPGVVILLLGLLMSGHHQTSMVSTMVHKQWGTLLVGFALARAVTYILLYINPPSSLLPARPPSELVASFCLISGGLIFMISARDIMTAMEAYDLNAMFVFTVGMGFTAFVMAWEIVCISLKAWATRRPALVAPSSFHFTP